LRSGRLNRRLDLLELATAHERRRGEDGYRADRGEHPEAERETARLCAQRIVAGSDQRLRVRERNRRRYCDAERAADLLRGVDQPRGEAGLVVLDTRERRDR